MGAVIDVLMAALMDLLKAFVTVSSMVVKIP